MKRRDSTSQLMQVNFSNSLSLYMSVHSFRLHSIQLFIHYAAIDSIWVSFFGKWHARNSKSLRRLFVYFRKWTTTEYIDIHIYFVPHMSLVNIIQIVFFRSCSIPSFRFFCSDNLKLHTHTMTWLGWLCHTFAHLDFAPMWYVTESFRNHNNNNRQYKYNQLHEFDGVASGQWLNLDSVFTSVCIRDCMRNKWAIGRPIACPQSHTWKCN